MRRETPDKRDENTPQGAVPAYLQDREGQSGANMHSTMIKHTQKEEAQKQEVPMPKVRNQVLKKQELKVTGTGTTKKKTRKRMAIEVCFIGDDFTGKPPKQKRFRGCFE